MKVENLPPDVKASMEKRLLSISSEYSKQSSASNGTVQTLLKIIVTFAEGSVMHDGDDESLDL